MSSPVAHGQNRQRLLLVLLCSTQFLNTLNLSSVNIALPDIAADLGFSEANLPWVIAAYALTFGGFLLVGGRVADLVGRRKVLAVGFAIFGVFTLVDALATSPVMLIAARGLQGIGAAITIPASLGILTNAFTGRAERSRAVGAFAAAGAVGFASGLVLGGVVTDVLGWRWVFGLTAPPVAVLLALTFALVPPDPAGSHARGRVDLPGALTATAGLLGLVFALTNAGEAGWSAPATLISLVVGIALLSVFLFLQTRVRDPLMPLHLWRRPNFAAVMVVAFCLYACWIGVTFFLALTLQEILGYSPTEAALALLPLTVGGLIGSTIAGRVLPRTGAKPLLVLGLSLYVAGIALAAFIDGDSTYWLHIFAAISLTAVGIPLAFVSSNVTALADAAPHEQSLVGGLFNTGVQVGGGLGLAVMSAVAATRIGRGDSGDALLSGYQAAFWTAVTIAALGLIVALFLVRDPSAKAPTGAAETLNLTDRFREHVRRRAGASVEASAPLGALPSLEGQGERHASWLELFFDLVFVAAVAALARQLHADHSIAGLAVFAGLFVPVWWGWMGYTWYATGFDSDDSVFRLGLLGGMLAIAALSAGVAGAASGDSETFVIAYACLFYVLSALYLRTWLRMPEARPLAARLGIGNALGATLWLASLALDENVRPLIWALAMILLIATFAFATWSLSFRPYDPAHVAERYGLFTIIVLGESVVVTVAGLETGSSLTAALVAVFGFVLAAAIWWLYFGIFRSMPVDRGFGGRFVWAQGHLLVFAGIAAAAVGVEFAIEAAAHGEPLTLADRLPLGAGLAAYMAALVAIRSANRRADWVVSLRLAVAGTVLVLAVAGLGLGSLAFVAVLASLLVVEAGAELALSPPTGERPAKPDSA